VDEAKLRDVIAFLEELGEDMSKLAELDEPTRIRLVSAAGQLARPDRYQRKALGKALHRAHKAARKEADQAILDQTGIRTLRREPVFKTPLLKPDMQLESRGDDEQPDLWSEAEANRPAPDEVGADAPRGTAEAPKVQDARMCYVCKTYFQELHHFYDQMCPPCAALNWEKRNSTADLRGRVVLVTGARVKIGYQAAIKLLRAGADVIVATRFPRDAARRFAKEVDATEWAQRLHVYGIDLRHTPVRRCAGRVAGTTTSSTARTRRPRSSSADSSIAIGRCGTSSRQEQNRGW
jgi:3-oxoacyl-ACP reductase-like protein